MDIYFRTLTGNDNLGCDCYLLDTLTLISTKIVGGTCGSPVAANGAVFDNTLKKDSMYFTNTPFQTAFLCSK